MPNEKEIENLPDIVPIFPLSGCILLPGCHLPLHVFEERYREMTRDALVEGGFIGVVQPRERQRQGEPKVFSLGGLGKIINSTKFTDGRYLILLEGVKLFEIGEELPKEGRLYRRVRPRYLGDESVFSQDPENAATDDFRRRILRAVRRYFRGKKVKVDWKSMEELSTSRLINALSQAMDFPPLEKQSLLEARSVQIRGELLLSLIEMFSRATTIPANGSEAGHDDPDSQLH